MRPLVSGRDLVLHRGGAIAVAASTFTVPASAITAIIGPNGSGKTTLLHALAGLIEPSQGDLEVDGAPVTAGRARTSYVLQAINVPAGTPLTVAEAVGMGRYPSLGRWRRRGRQDRERVRVAMQRLGVDDLARRPVSELSGGQRQRVFVAQGLAQDHDLLLLDEPLTSLDLVSARTIDAIIHTERDQRNTVVITTHDLEEAQAADHVILMKGRVLATGPPAAVLTREHLEQAYGLGALHTPEGAGRPDLPTQVIDDPAHTRPSPPGPPAEDGVR